MDSNDAEWFESEVSPSRRFSIYLPSRRRDGSPLEDVEAIASLTMELLSGLFGGATAYPATGMFGSSGQKEEIRMIESFCQKASWDEHSQFIHVFLAILAAILRQEALGCALDGQVAFVRPVSGSLPGHLPKDVTALKRLVMGFIKASADQV